LLRIAEEYLVLNELRTREGRFVGSLSTYALETANSLAISWNFRRIVRPVSSYGFPRVIRHNAESRKAHKMLRGRAAYFGKSHGLVRALISAICSKARLLRGYGGAQIVRE
jgi:hypothetical protein